MRYPLLIMTMLILLIFLSICLLFSEQILLPAGVYINQVRNTDGTATFTVRTISYGGPYAPRNAGVIWISNANNQFVKTIKIWAATYRWTLVRWMAASGNNTIGAITSASLNNHQLHTVTWNGTNSSGALQADGNYTFNVEFTEHNATSSNMGKYTSKTFNKSSSPIDQTYPNETYFSNLHLTWTPVITNGTISGTVTNFNNEPIPNATISAGGSYITSSSANGSYSLSVPAGNYSLTCTATGYDPQSFDNVIVTAGQVTTVNFFLSFVSNEDPTTPSPSVLIQNYPNPFSHSTLVRYNLAKPTSVLLQVYNIKGQKVKTLENSTKNAGWYSINWNATDDNGKRLPSGIYTLRIKFNTAVYSKNLTIN